MDGSPSPREDWRAKMTIKGKQMNIVEALLWALSDYNATPGTTTTGHLVPPLYSRFLYGPLLCSFQIQSPRQHPLEWPTPGHRATAELLEEGKREHAENTWKAPSLWLSDISAKQPLHSHSLGTRGVPVLSVFPTTLT